MRIICIWYLLLGLLCGSCNLSLPEEVEIAYESLPSTIDFNYHVKPILSDRCYACHGPDENTRKAGLRLDIEENAFRRLSSGNFAIIAGKPSRSESVRRILSEDPEVLMPPPASHLSLNAKDKATIIKWIDQGAKWKDHWAFTKPVKPRRPSRLNRDWISHNPIDEFVQNKLIQEALAPSPEADKERLLRRVTMDLTGLPPTISEIDSFLADTSDYAYEKVVDRLLGTDACAERLALDWMDVSRYADSHGLHADGWRLMWPWRDWVIGAFKDNMPYDQFITWQLAGDLLPEARKDQKLATAFNRNHPMTAEGGAIEEEFRLNYVWDRAETVGTALMGLTINCARCHDHKFDPITQKDYYQFTAFFNNVKELGMTGDDGNYGPMLALPEADTEKKLQQLSSRIWEKEEALKLTKKELKALNAYIKQLPTSYSKKDLLGHYPFDKVVKQQGKRKGYYIDANTRSRSNEAPMVVAGKMGMALEFTGEYDEVYLHDIPNFELTDAFSAALWMNTTKREAGKTQTLMGTSGEKNNFWRGWDLYLDSLNQLNIRLIHSLPHNYIHLRSADSLKTNQWRHVAFTYNGSGKAKDLTLYLDGEEMQANIVYDKLYKSIKTIKVASHEVYNQPIRVAKSYRAYTGENGIFKGKIDDIYIFSRSLTALEVSDISGFRTQTDVPAPDYWIAQSPEVRSLEKELKAVREQWLAHMMPVMEIMVMEEMPQPRPAYAYNRGDYQQPIYRVNANTPAVLAKFPDTYPRNRLGLAQWLFSSDNPLTARVAVNRYWQMLFGNGLVRTPQDFGVQGELPTHPQLMDWLATSFIESGWDIRKLLRSMVLSHTYRQSSQLSETLRDRDPNNIYLARSNSYRLPAEMIRDNALAASGLLVKQVGGESVKPYQPENLWIEQTNFSHKLLHYKESEGDSVYRRGLYTFIRRTAPHPAMIAFDAPNREVCTIKRENTNTPLQALVLMNETQFVEASKVLAARMQQEGGTALEEQITYGFRLATGRYPKKEENQILQELFNAQLQRYTANTNDASKLLAVGRKKIDEQLDTRKSAAMAMVANTILNHDDTYMKR